MVKGADSPSNINPAARDSSGAALINERSIVPRLRVARDSKTKFENHKNAEKAAIFAIILMKLIGEPAQTC